MVKFNHHVIFDSLQMKHLRDKGMKWHGYVSACFGKNVIRQGYNKKNETSYSWEDNSASLFYKSDICSMWKMKTVVLTQERYYAMILT